MKKCRDKDTKYLIAYHDNCMDGYSAAYVTHRALLNRSVSPANITLLPVTYGKLDTFAQTLLTVDVVYVVDFSLPIGLMKSIEEQAPHVDITILDHHKRAQETYGFLGIVHGVGVVLNMEESGATLAWKYFNDTPVPVMLMYVKDYDLWKFDYSDTKQVNAYLNLQEKSLANWHTLIQEFEHPDFITEATAIGAAVLAYHNNIVEKLLEGAALTEIEGHKGLAVNCPSVFANDVGEALAVKCGTFGITWQQIKGEVKCSLRSSRHHGNFDVDALAAKFNGGGHRNAAGFVLAAPQADPDKEGVTLWRT